MGRDSDGTMIHLFPNDPGHAEMVAQIATGASALAMPSTQTQSGRGLTVDTTQNIQPVPPTTSTAQPATNATASLMRGKPIRKEM